MKYDKALLNFLDDVILKQYELMEKLHSLRNEVSINLSDTIDSGLSNSQAVRQIIENCIAIKGRPMQSHEIAEFAQVSGYDISTGYVSMVCGRIKAMKMVKQDGKRPFYYYPVSWLNDDGNLRPQYQEVADNHKLQVFT